MIDWNISIREHNLPISAVLGLLATAVVWVMVLAEQPFLRNVGFGWMVIGIIGYVLYRRRENLPIIGKGE